MAGRNQHHIPQSLLKCFARDPSETPMRVWEYRRGAPVAPRPTYEVAAQRDFYSKPSPDGQPVLDDTITDYEGDHFAPLLKRLLSTDAGAEVIHKDASDFLGHLVPRGDHLRRLFSETVTRFLNDGTVFMADPTKIANRLGLDSLEPGGEALAQIRRLMADPKIAPFLELVQIPSQLVERVGFALLREHAPLALKEAAATASKELSLMSIDVKQQVRQAHTEVLERVGVGNGMPGLEHLTFTIEQTTRELLLPDCVAIAFNEHGAALPLMLMKRAEVVGIVAPLSPYRALVGRAPSAAALPGDDEQLAGKLAACSHMFFVASSDHFRDLHSKLGEISNVEVERVIEGIFTPSAGTSLVTAPPSSSAQDFRFELQTPDDFSAEEKQELASVLEEMASAIHSSKPMEALVALTIVSEGGLDECGRYLIDPKVVGGTIESDRLELWGTMPRAVGKVLASEAHQDDYRLALLTLSATLTRAAAMSELDRLSEHYYRRAANMHYRGLAGALASFPSLALVRRASTDRRLFDLVDAAASDALKRADTQMSATKERFATSGDNSEFARAAADCVSIVCNACGAAAGIDQAELDELPLLRSALRERGLLAWFRRYALDLANFWDNPAATSVPAVWGLHSERLLLSWGVVCWFVENDLVRWWIPPPEGVAAIEKILSAIAEQSEN